MIMKRLLVLALALAMFLSFTPVFQHAHAQDESDVNIFVVGPDALGISDQAVYTITVVGGPAEEEGGKWRVSAHLTGKNITDASPNLANAFNETNESNTFQVDVTASSLAQNMVLNIQAASILGANITLANDTYKIAVVEPINLRATITNPTNSTLKNVLVNFKVDGQLIGSSEPIVEIGPSGEGTATFSWITKNISPGRHELEIEIDLNGDGIIDERRGEALFIESFHGPVGDSNILFVILTIVLFIVVLLLLPSTLRKKRRRK
ncbi:MAG: hypothetical protein KAW09_02105 [Thermoplasmata archaeon]|nr:hypothetical protein [Thermoplasmata archaeon]